MGRTAHLSKGRRYSGRVEVLAFVHGPLVGPGVFADAVAARGHRLVEWSPAVRAASPPPHEEYGAVLVLGGAMHVDQEEQHPWLREEDAVLRRLLESGTPVLGVCLGAQLLAKAAGARVGPASQPEIGWHRVELTEAAADDPVVGRLPRSFEAFEWHYYAFELPDGANELARTSASLQSFRLGGRAWGVQFHPEVTLAQARQWIEEKEEVPTDRAALLRQTEARIEEWNELGRTLCDAFLEVAERIGAPTAERV
jgi:GMP synthase (glutamine-hydrolysing)